MKNWLSRSVINCVLGLVATCSISSAHAVLIEYEQISQVGNHYEYSYTVTNDDLPLIDEFSIYFAEGSYENLSVTSSPTDWDGLAIEPDSFFGDDGFVDWLALGAPLLIGETLAGFNLAFDWIGGSAGPEESHFFEIIDSFTFDVIADGFTVRKAAGPTDPSKVSEPGAAMLFCLGLLALVRVRSRKV